MITDLGKPMACESQRLIRAEIIYIRAGVGVLTQRHATSVYSVSQGKIDRKVDRKADFLLTLYFRGEGSG